MKEDGRMSLPAKFAVGDRQIGGSAPTYVIAEAGSNHNGDMAIAKRLIEVAADAGADAVKFQTYSGNRIYSRKAESKFLAQWTTKSPAELLEDISLPREWHAELAEHARSRDIDFFSTPFDEDAVTLIAEVGAPLLKIASGEIVDLPLVRAAAGTGLPLIISTGMATLAEIEAAVDAAARAGGPAGGPRQSGAGGGAGRRPHAIRVGVPGPGGAHQPACDGDAARGVRRARGPVGPLDRD